MRRLAFAALLVLLQGCAASTSGARDGYDQNVITREEIQAAPASNLWDLINDLRPRWLQVIDSPNFGGGEARLLVYRDNVQLEGPEILRSLSPETAVELQFLDEMAATSRFSRAMSSGRIAGAIIIVTRLP